MEAEDAVMSLLALKMEGSKDKQWRLHLEVGKGKKIGFSLELPEGMQP